MYDNERLKSHFYAYIFIIREEIWEIKSVANRTFYINILSTEISIVLYKIESECRIFIVAIS